MKIYIKSTMSRDEIAQEISDEMERAMERRAKRRSHPKQEQTLYYTVEPKPKQSLWQKFLGLFNRDK